MNMYMIVHVLLVQSQKESKRAFLLHSDVLKWVCEQGLWYTLGLIGRKWVELQELKSHPHTCKLNLDCIGIKLTPTKGYGYG